MLLQIGGIFPELNTVKECEDLVNEFQTQPIAFFSHLRASLIDDDLWKEIQVVGGTRKAIELIARNKEPYLLPKIQFTRLLEVGKSLLQSGQLINHLRLN